MGMQRRHGTDVSTLPEMMMKRGAKKTNKPKSPSKPFLGLLLYTLLETFLLYNDLLSRSSLSLFRFCFFKRLKANTIFVYLMFCLLYHDYNCGIYLKRTSPVKLHLFSGT